MEYSEKEWKLKQEVKKLKTKVKKQMVRNSSFEDCILMKI